MKPVSELTFLVCSVPFVMQQRALIHSFTLFSASVKNLEPLAKLRKTSVRRLFTSKSSLIQQNKSHRPKYPHQNKVNFSNKIDFSMPLLWGPPYKKRHKDLKWGPGSTTNHIKGRRSTECGGEELNLTQKFERDKNKTRRLCSQSDESGRVSAH